MPRQGEKQEEEEQQIWAENWREEIWAAVCSCRVRESELEEEELLVPDEDWWAEDWWRGQWL